MHLELAQRDARLSKLWLVNTRPPNAAGLARPPQQAAHAIRDKYRIPPRPPGSSAIEYPVSLTGAPLPPGPGTHKSAVAAEEAPRELQSPPPPHLPPSQRGETAAQNSGGNQHIFRLKPEVVGYCSAQLPPSSAAITAAMMDGRTSNRPSGPGGKKARFGFPPRRAARNIFQLI